MILLIWLSPCETQQIIHWYDVLNKYGNWYFGLKKIRHPYHIRRRAITWTNTGLLLIWPVRKDFSVILINI